MKDIKIGVITNTHGLKGEVKVKNLSDFLELRYRKGNVIHLHYGDESLPLRIQSVRDGKDLLIVKFEEFDDINQVEIWKGSCLYVEDSELQELEEDEAYYHELQDSKVYDMEAQYLGTVSEIIETGANVVLRVSGGERELLIPFVKAFVKQFDKLEKRMVVEVMEGL